MDSVTQAKRSEVADALAAALPPEAPLEMREQQLWTARPALRLAIAPPMMGLRRFVVIGLTIVLTVVAAFEMYMVVTVNGTTPLQALIVALYVALFAWIALSFVTALIGFVAYVFGARDAAGIDASGALPELGSRCALLFPTYNEVPGRLMARVQTIYESVASSGRSAHFDVFILSDTTDPEIWLEEERQFLALRERTNGSDKFFYRHRYRNEGRKAGNIAEWVRRFGGRYQAMVVLDADSLMTSDTLVRLVHGLEQNPRVALIQTLPKIINANTLFARLQQFAGSVYGPLVAYGIAWWHGTEGNYWGHNAAIRVEAFAEAAGLPMLSGRKPFGGSILSHDFVEAALIRRRGWAICMAPALSGSYEETPPSLTEHATRDRRWCQGNLQHIGVLPARGLHWISRLHLMMGIGSYVTAPMWLIFLLLGVLLSLQAQFIRPDYFPSGFTLFPKWPTQDPVRAAWVFAGTMALLIAPKLLGYIAVLLRPSQRKRYGGALRLFLGVLIETLISGLIAPVMMWKQTIAVLQVLSGADSGWNAQRRDEQSAPWRANVRAYVGPTIGGILLAAAAYAVSLPLLLWMSPVILGLLLAIPLAASTSSASLGEAARRLGLMVIPEERDPPEVVKRADALGELQASDATGSLSQQLSQHPELWAAHAAMLPARHQPRSGQIDVDLVIGLAKLEECESFDDALGLLTRSEKNALLASATGFAKLRSKWERSGA